MGLECSGTNDVKATEFTLVGGKMYKTNMNCIDRGQEKAASEGRGCRLVATTTS